MAFLIKTISGLLAFCFMICATVAGDAAAENSDPGKVLILCYHSIQPQARPGDPYTLPQRRFVEQMEYLHAHGWQPVSLETLLAAREGKQRLPDKAVLLTFDDAYRSYHDFVVPVLRMYGFPSMLAVVGTWIENDPPEDLAEALMTWEQIRGVAADPLVTIVSHTYDLHRSVQYTPQGNVGAVVGVRAYDPQAGTYETESRHRQKLQDDFKRQQDLFQRRIGRVPRAIVWPYGAFTAVSTAVAAENGMQIGFSLDEKELGWAYVSNPGTLNRLLVINEPIDLFIYSLKHLGADPAPMRAVQVDLDLIYDPQSAEATDRNLGRLIDRLVAMKVNTVFLQAFADPDGSGDIRSVYFHNRVLPVRADIFGHAAHQLRIRGIDVYAWMPTLSFVFEDEAFNARFRVREHRNGQSAHTAAWYPRLTPFSQEVAQRVAMLFEDLAAGSRISGILFQDDAYLTDFEDYHPLALEAFAAHMGEPISPDRLTADDALSKQWMQFKTERLLTYTEQMAGAVRRHRPDALFARNIYARLLTEPWAEAWFAQNFELFLDRYDYVVVMAYPQMEKARRPISWLQDLAAAATRNRSVSKTVFKLQAYDWERDRWLPDALLLEEMRAVLAAGIRHLAYYPDNLWEEKPHLPTVSLEMSTRSTVEGE